MSKKGKNTGLKTPSLRRNLLGGLIFVVGLLLVIRIVLLIVTQHYKTVTVPDFTGLQMDEVESMARKDGLRMIASDSVYVRSVDKGAVFSQNPSAGSKVKKGRAVYITLNASRDKEVMMPDVTGYSLRQAIVELTSRGLVVGDLRYVYDIATDNVLGQSRPEGMLVSVGTVVDLVLGLDPNDTFVTAPNVIGQSLDAAINTLKTNSLNYSVHLDNTISSEKDIEKAFVYDQIPETHIEPANRGDYVDIYLTLDSGKLPSPSREKDPSGVEEDEQI